MAGTGLMHRTEPRRLYFHYGHLHTAIILIEYCFPPGIHFSYYLTEVFLFLSHCLLVPRAYQAEVVTNTPSRCPDTSHCVPTGDGGAVYVSHL